MGWDLYVVVPFSTQNNTRDVSSSSSTSPSTLETHVHLGHASAGNMFRFNYRQFFEEIVRPMQQQLGPTVIPDYLYDRLESFYTRLVDRHNQITHLFEKSGADRIIEFIDHNADMLWRCLKPSLPADAYQRSIQCLFELPPPRSVAETIRRFNIDCQKPAGANNELLVSNSLFVTCARETEQIVDNRLLSYWQLATNSASCQQIAMDDILTVLKRLVRHYDDANNNKKIKKSKSQQHTCRPYVYFYSDEERIEHGDGDSLFPYMSLDDAWNTITNGYPDYVEKRRLTVPEMIQKYRPGGWGIMVGRIYCSDHNTFG